jgi:WD40 repeat protein
VKALAWSSDSDSLAAGAADGTVSLHRVTREAPPLRLLAHKQALTHLSFSHDGQRLITRSPEAVAVWDTANGEVLDNFEVSTRSGTTIFTDGQGQHRAIIDDQNQVFLLGTDRPDRRLGRIAGAQFGRVRQLFFSPQDRWLATAGEEHTARIWNLETAEEHLAFPDRVHEVVFSADGRLAAVLDATTSATIWDVGERRLLKRLRGHELPVESAAFDDRGRVVATGDSQGWVKLWTAQPGRQRFQEQTWVWGVSYSPDGRYLAMTPLIRGVWVLDAHSGQVRWIVKAPVEEVFTTAFSPLDSHLLVTGGSHYVARLFDLRTGRKLRSFLGHQDNIWAIKFSPDGKLLATASADGSVRLWEVDSGRLLRVIETGFGSVYSVDISLDGSYLIASGECPVAAVWEMTSGRMLRQFAPRDPCVRAARFTADPNSATPPRSRCSASNGPRASCRNSRIYRPTNSGP